MLAFIVTRQERSMSKQMLLFEVLEPNWAERLQRRLDAETRHRINAILVEMAHAALQVPAQGQQEVQSDED